MCEVGVGLSIQVDIFEQSNKAFRYSRRTHSALTLIGALTMAAVVAVKKELRKQIKTILKDVSDASAATQSMSSLLISYTS